MGDSVLCNFGGRCRGGNVSRSSLRDVYTMCDVSIDTTENAMLKLLRSQTSGILNIPQGCDRIRDIFIVEISRQY